MILKKFIFTSFVIFLALIFRFFVCAFHYIPSQSMLPSLASGNLAMEWVSAYNFQIPNIYGLNYFIKPFKIWYRTPHIGDVVDLDYPGRLGIFYVKRIIGLEGDVIEMRDGRLYRNGECLDKNYHKMNLSPLGYPLSVSAYEETLLGKTYPVLHEKNAGLYDETFRYKIPKGKVFVLGDSRDYSADSRVSRDHGGLEFIDMSSINGKIVFVPFSFYENSLLLNFSQMHRVF